MEIIEGNSDKIKYKYLLLNILHHQRKDDEVLQYITEMLKEISDSDDEYYYVILRNSAHLFLVDNARDNLTRSMNFFREASNSFAETTCLNNLGIVELYANKEEDAYEIFQQAEHKFSELLSNEIYQPRFNLGVTSFMMGNYQSAKEYYHSAFKSLPTSLDYDRIKFESNNMWNSLLLRDIEKNELLDFYDNSIENSGHVPDPWLEFMLKYNKGSLIELSDKQLGMQTKEEAKNNYIGNPDIYGIKYHVKQLDVQILLAISPHWRY